SRSGAIEGRPTSACSLVKCTSSAVGTSLTMRRITAACAKQAHASRGRHRRTNHLCADPSPACLPPSLARRQNQMRTGGFFQRTARILHVNLYAVGHTEFEIGGGNSSHWPDSVIKIVKMVVPVEEHRFQVEQRFSSRLEET